MPLPQQPKVGIYGGSGYVGLELIRLLLQHPNATLAAVTSREHGGKPLSDVHKSLQGLTSLSFTSPEEDLSGLDVLFVSVPHTQAIPIVSKLAQSTRFQQGQLHIIDMGGDFRLSAEAFLHHYKTAHTSPTLLDTAVYGSPELNAEAVKQARLIANPGCFANCTTLALAPLVIGLEKHGISSDKLVARVSAITGSSGSGITPTIKTHHPERNDSLAAYEVLTHRHIPEIEKALSIGAHKSASAQVRLVPISGPISRGIFATVFVNLPSADLPIQKFYSDFAAQHPFIRIRQGTPRVLDVRGSNFCDLAIHQAGTELVIISTLDNLVKGAAGNAIQNLNLLMGLPQTQGLLFAPLTP